MKKSRVLTCLIWLLAGMGANAQLTTTFSYTGGVQTYTVPVGVMSVSIDCYGAQGGAAYYTTSYGVGAFGGEAYGIVPVTPGEILQIYVGGAGGNGTLAVGGTGGFNGGANGGSNTDGQAGGGGGGASDVRRIPSSLNDRVIVAGGGGGAASCSASAYGGGLGGGLIGGTPPLSCGTPNNSSTGGTQSAGGIGGSYTGWCVAGNGTFGNGAAGCTPAGSGGGAGGWYGGGGGSWMGGGGGSSYTNGTVTGVVHTQGVRSGNGQIIITILYSASITQSVQILCNGQSTASVTATPNGGVGPYTYSWAPSGGTAATASGLSAGVYTVTVTDALSNITTQTINITQPALLSATTTQTDVSCNGGNNGTAMVTVSGGTGPYTYLWAPSGGTGSTEINLTAGTYTCNITDANGCSTSQNVTLTQPGSVVPALTAGSILCNGGTTTVTVAGSGGVGPYTGEGTFTVGAGVQSYTITDANGCTGTASITITEPTPLTANVTVTPIACFGGSAIVTVVAVGGTSPFTGEGNFTDVAGTYNYVITDANGCTNTTSITLTEPPAISASVTSVNVTCNGGNNGSIDLTVSGGTSPYTFDWNSGTYFTEDLNGLTAGIYSGVLTDANGCTNGGSVTITEPSAIIATFTSTDPSTCSGTDGAIDVTVTGGTPVYTFLWSNSATSEDISSIAAGTYSCTITDTSGCSSSISVTIADPNGPNVTIALAVSTVCADDASITLSGGSPLGGVYSGVSVSGGVFDPSSTVLGANTITYTYIDSITGCEGEATDIITVNACTGIETSLSNDNIFTLMPNPNNGTFILQLNTTEAADVFIYDAIGKLIISQTVQPTVQQQMNIENAGVYMMTIITSNGQRISQKIVVN